MEYVCEVCGWIYDPAKGDAEGSVLPGVDFADLPDDWICPECGVGKTEFRRLTHTPPKAESGSRQ